MKSIQFLSKIYWICIFYISTAGMSGTSMITFMHNKEARLEQQQFLFTFISFSVIKHFLNSQQTLPSWNNRIFSILFFSVLQYMFKTNRCKYNTLLKYLLFDVYWLIITLIKIIFYLGLRIMSLLSCFGRKNSNSHYENCVNVIDLNNSYLFDVPLEVFLYERTLEKLLLSSNHVRILIF